MITEVADLITIAALLQTSDQTLIELKVLKNLPRPRFEQDPANLLNAPVKTRNVRFVWHFQLDTRFDYS